MMGLMSAYAGSWEYLLACAADGSIRYDINGTPVGEVSAEDRTRAAMLLLASAMRDLAVSERRTLDAEPPHGTVPPIEPFLKPAKIDVLGHDRAPALIHSFKIIFIKMQNILFRNRTL